ncbi:MAG: hypothetical protein ACREND_03235 [Gemmatimonadaceae bacterium]
MRRPLVSIVIALGMAACGSSTSPAPTLNGSWTGSDPNSSLSLTLTQSGTQVTGTGQLVSGTTYPLTVTGIVAEPAFSLSMTPGQFAPVTYTGSLSHDSLTGRLNGSGFDNESITLARQ